MKPTKRLWGLVALGIPIAAYGGSVGSVWPILTYNLLLLVAAWGSGKLAPPIAFLQVCREFDPVLSVRVSNRVELVLENDGSEPISGRFRDEPPSSFEATEHEFNVKLEPGEIKRIHYGLTPVERGDDLFRGSFFCQDCPLGLVEKIHKLDTEQVVRTYPNVLAMREFDLLKQRGRLNEMGIRRSQVRGLGSEFESLREYGTGDDYRKIDWKATARKGKLVVRQFEQERNQAVILCLDIGRRMLSEVDGVTKLDHALDSILMLANAVVQAGDQIGLLVYAERVRRYVPPKKGKAQLGIIIEAIHDLVAEPVESDSLAAFSYLGSRWKRRSLLVAFSDSEDRDQAFELIRGLGPVIRRHLTLLSRVSDPRLAEIVDAPVKNLDGLYRKAAGLFLVSERREAAVAFDSSGLHTLEAEPQNLSAALVSYYFMVKERSLI